MALVKITSSWIERSPNQNQPTAVSWQYRDTVNIGPTDTNFVEWGAFNDDTTWDAIVLMDTVVQFMDPSSGNDSAISFNGDGDIVDAQGNALSDWDLTMWLPGELGQCIYDGTCYGWGVTKFDMSDTTRGVSNGAYTYVRLNSSTASFGRAYTVQWFVTYEAAATAWPFRRRHSKVVTITRPKG
jgi:hypothetical protein